MLKLWFETDDAVTAYQQSFVLNLNKVFDIVYTARRIRTPRNTTALSEEKVIKTNCNAARPVLLC